MLSSLAMTLVKTYSTRLDADLARIALQAEGIASTVVGVDITMDAGTDGVRLLVADDQADAARAVLGDGHEPVVKAQT